MVVALEGRLVDEVAREVGVQARQVAAADRLLAEGATVPFIARYRKEATGGLDDAQLEAIAKRREYFLELTERRDAVLDSIAGQGKLDAALEAAIRRALTKQELEDLYLPFKPRRRTRAQKARERGLEPLADALLAHARDAGADPNRLAAPFVNASREVPSAEAALDGARDILAERVSEEAGHRARLRRVMLQEGMVEVRVASGKEKDDAAQVYRDWFDHREAAARIASHRMLAMLRGEREEVLRLEIGIDDEREQTELCRTAGLDPRTRCGREVETAIRDSYKRLLRPSLRNEVVATLRERAEDEAIRVFRANLEALLLQSPFGQLAAMGLDPGFRSGCKVAVVDDTGKVVHAGVIYLLGAGPAAAQAADTLRRLVRAHGVRAVAVGNGTASRETEEFARNALREGETESVVVAIVPETGASVYSASALAREELPDLDVSLRGAVSIARRLQDPLAELVKIDPRSMGVGQYQHDLEAKKLALELDRTVEAVVNRVGVELNSASWALLRRVSGLSDRLARAIVERRDQQGRFRSRKTLLQVPGVGPRTFELAAGFLRIRGADHPLDSTAVHPERYALVEAMARRQSVPLGDLVGNPALVARLDFDAFRSEAEGVGRYTLDDIRAELERPGRDPRPHFKVPEWREDVRTLEDLQQGMVLEGRVSNVTNFGAFVDIGIKRDGLVHVSELSRRFVSDPREVVKVGQIVRVQVTEVDRQRGRVGLSMKVLETEADQPDQARRPARESREPRPQPPEPRQPPKGATLDDLARKFGRKPGPPGRG